MERKQANANGFCDFHSRKFRLLSIALAGAGILSGAQAWAQTVPVVTGDARVDKLLSQMTLEEKMGLIRGATENPATNQDQAGYLPGVPRLGIPPLRLSDGPPGVLTRYPSTAETATMGVAATFSKADAEANGAVIAREAKSLGIDVVLEPFINIDRDITFTRGYNTEGEDPVLTGEMGAALVRGIQEQGVMAQAKHFVAYDTDGSSVWVDQQALHEIYVNPFLDAIHAGVSSIMCSYNKVNGEQACGNPATLVEILRKQAGFKGFVTSDWGAVHAASYINNGLDMEMPGIMPPDSMIGYAIFSFFDTHKPEHRSMPKVDMSMMGGFFAANMPEEPAPKSVNLGEFGTMRDKKDSFFDLMQRGEVKEAAITRAAGHVLYEYEKFGYLDHPTPGQLGPKNPPVHAVEENAKVIRKTAEDGAVLLKNSGGILPLKADDLASVAMIGPGAGQTIAIGVAGERSIGWPWRQIGTVEALRKMDPEARIAYAVEDDMTGKPIPAELWTHDGKPGLERTSADGTTSVDPIIDFTAQNGSALPADTHASWLATLNVPADGTYWVYLQLLGAAGTLKIDGNNIVGANGMRGAVHGDTVLGGKDGLMPTTDGLDNLRVAVPLTKGAHKVEVHILEDTSHQPAQVRLAWVTPAEREANHAAAIAAARAAKVAVVFAWTRGKTDFALASNSAYNQDKLIEEVAAVNPNTVVVLNVSQPVAMPWLDKVKAVLQMWWPGDEGGWATAALLDGTANPAGRLPFTWAKALTDYPATNPKYPERSAKGVDGKTTFSEGIFVGYRWFDKEGLAPLYPFGYGLSYTTFAYSGLKVTTTGDGGLDVNFTVRNTGSRTGDDVPQVYLGRPVLKFPGEFPLHALAAFDRLTLAPGETKLVTIHVERHRLEFWSTPDSRWVLAAGTREVLVGGSSRSLPLHQTVTIR